MKLLLWLLVCWASARAQAGNNAPEQLGKHSVVLVSLDGFRPDYPKRYGARNLLAMAANGASAPDGMLPSYPSLTLPNRYTLVTGLYPEHHGIVADSFYEGSRKYSAANPPSIADGGVPLWLLAERQGMRAACISCSGPEAATGGRPSLFHDDVPDAARVDLVLQWLKLPEGQRPHFITLSFADVDRAGRRFGPDAPQTRAAVLAVDAQLGRLRAGLRGLHLPVDLIVVSDHGMAKTEGGSIDLDKYVDLQGFDTVGPLLYAKTEEDAQKAYSRLKIANAAFKVYRRANVPRELHYNANPRIGDPVIIPNAPVAIRAHGPAAGEADPAPDAGSDGYDPRQFGEMRAIFYAEGPDIRAGVKLKLFENVNVYPFVAGLLGLDAPKVDGSAAVLSGVVR